MSGDLAKLLLGMFGDTTRHNSHGILDKLHSVFVEPQLVRSLYHQLCPDVKMEHMMEQRVNVKFCVELQKSPSGMFEVLNTVCG
jgi:hypothetical protein